jgi:hypothetical protein
MIENDMRYPILIDSTVHHEHTLPRSSHNLEILTSLGSSIMISGLST